MGYTTHGCIGMTIRLNARARIHTPLSTDTMTSLDSTAPYSASHMRDLSGLVKQLICTFALCEYSDTFMTNTRISIALNRSGKASDYIISASGMCDSSLSLILQ